jgi:nicotinate-nucleotide adenylyltransferase
MKNVIKIGLLGGAFDPPTLGHLALGDYLIKTKVVDQVWLEPCYKSYYDKDMRSPEIRLQMCEASIRDFGNPNIKVCDFEIANKLTCETNEGIDLFLKQYGKPNVQYYFMIGMDNANKIHTWGNWEELTSKIPFIVFPRGGYTVDPIRSWYLKPPHIFLTDYTPIEISSTQIRKFYKDRTDESHHAQITDSVKDLIDELKLYD